MNQFKRTLRSDLKRSLLLTPQIIIYTLLFLLASFVIIIYGSKMFFSNTAFNQVNVALYMPEDSKYNSLGLSFVQDMQSFRDSVNIIEVSSPEEGLEMIEKDKTLVFVEIPEEFVRSVLNGSNYSIKIIFKNNDTLDEHIVNDLLLSLSDVLGVAQASVYTLGDIYYSQGIDSEESSSHYNKLNTENFFYVTSRDAIFDQKLFDSISRFTLQQSMAGAYLILILFFSCFTLASFFKLNSYSYMLQQRAHKVTKTKVFISEFLTAAIPVYVSFLIIYLAFLIASFKPKLTALIVMMPVSLLISFIITLVFTLIKNKVYANLCIFVSVILVMYISGGLVPLELLPAFLKNTASYNPFYHLLRVVLASLF